jgi:hypothetical protein
MEEKVFAHEISMSGFESFNRGFMRLTSQNRREAQYLIGANHPHDNGLSPVRNHRLFGPARTQEKNPSCRLPFHEEGATWGIKHRKNFRCKHAISFFASPADISLAKQSTSSEFPRSCKALVESNKPPSLLQCGQTSSQTIGSIRDEI